MGFYKEGLTVTGERVKCGHNHHTIEKAENCLVLHNISDIKVGGYKRPKYKSRATRCSEACENLSSAASIMEELAGEIETILGEEPIDLTQIDEMHINLQLNAASIDWSNGYSELESLKGEIEDLVSNMQGTNLESTQRYQTFEETLSTLDNALSEAENCEPPELSEITEDSLEEFKNALEQKASNLESAASDAESTEYPGMYG